MGWSGPREGYRSIAAAINAEFNPEHIDEQRIVGPGLAWVLLNASATESGEPLICCVLLEGGLAKIMSTAEGPYYTGCPLAWYARVPVAEYGYDAEWRRRNRAAAQDGQDRRRSLGAGVH